MKSRLLVVVLGLILLAACSPQPQIRSDKYLPDTSFIDGDPCGPPCWRGITPGETLWNDAVAIIENDATLKDFESREAEDGDQIGAAWAPVDGIGCCQMITEDGQVVSFLFIQTTPDAQLEQVIEARGEPTYLIGDTVDSKQGLVSLFYPDIPMLIYVFFEGDDGSITPASEIVGFGYMTHDLMQFLIDTNDLHAWEGYRTYQYYNESDFEVTPSITLTPSD